ncbi:hypothetical protein B0T16DRAFT_79129 [Cercophora newfieldiana]|uniref:Uncharacterized protein n=1 Tax=Cercophora newfieldiana TaxID=92897 RepID=A0AA39YFI4_9PEZI|nr:hypothetical protein B0T16DRAFT_79129 [Cercophora newfieldiana]
MQDGRRIHTTMFGTSRPQPRDGAPAGRSGSVEQCFATLCSWHSPLSCCCCRGSEGHGGSRNHRPELLCWHRWRFRQRYVAAADQSNKIMSTRNAFPRQSELSGRGAPLGDVSLNPTLRDVLLKVGEHSQPELRGKLLSKPISTTKFCIFEGCRKFLQIPNLPCILWRLERKLLMCFLIASVYCVRQISLPQTSQWRWPRRVDLTQEGCKGPPHPEPQF